MKIKEKNGGWGVRSGGDVRGGGHRVDVNKELNFCENSKKKEKVKKKKN